MRSIICIVCTLFIIAGLAHSKEKISLVRIENLTEQEIGAEMIPIIYKKAGLVVETTPLPGLRAKAMATTGEKDGEMMRIWSFGEKNKSLVRVPTHYLTLETMPFYKRNQGISIKTPDDLKNYKVVIVRGVQHSKDITAGVPKEKLHVVNTTEQMMQFLSSGRADVAIDNTITGLIVLKKLNINNVEHAERPLKVLKLYNYLHKNQKHLVPVVDDAIKSMKKSGELQKLQNSIEKKYLK